ncbi:hypothetical protein OG689_07075 [Kitasatospora sp. NBC_00240]|uniref:hypothetical protein n=1 Tax=Kitasatospora sp. NBC_00240 TaxID=2903567 RepID=UPI002250A172|nr:hypothetical protein [Kitasatospora sp. NBC_00240]MCX5209052.1 hypothetical protein [Kitasatospora sp. NBC_00240]
MSTRDHAGRADRARRPAPWVRTRLRAAPPAVLLGAALAFVLVLLAAALPRALDRGADSALRTYLRDAGPAATSLLISAPAKSGQDSPERLATALATLRSRVGAAFRLDPSGPVHGARGLHPRSLSNPELARPETVPPQLGLYFLPAVADHVQLVEGNWPAGGTADGPIPVALAAEAAATLGARVGSVLEAPSSVGVPLQAQVVGLYRAGDPAETYWTGLSCLTEACLSLTSVLPAETFWTTAGLVGPESVGRLLDWGVRAEDFWRLPLDPGALRADRLAGTQAEVASFVAGPDAAELATATGRSELRVASDLPDLFARALTRRFAAAPLTAVGPAGVAGVALVVLCLAAGLTADRRAGELRLLRARGGSRAGILGRLLGEGAVTVLPAAAVATLLAFVLLPTPRWTAALLGALATTLLALLALPVRAAVLLAAPRQAGGRRRAVAELAVLAATVAAVSEVRRRGVAPPGEGLDPLLVAAPLLLALSGALLLARLQPALVGALARAAGRGPGAIGFLGLARAARGTGARRGVSVLPLLALLLAVTTAGFGATVLDAVDHSRLRVARLAVGGDAAVTAPARGSLSDAFTRAAAELPGVRTATALWTDDDIALPPAAGRDQATVVVADPAGYAELARTVGRGRFDPALLAGAGPGAPVPALVSADLAGRLGREAFPLRLAGGTEFLATVAGVVDGTPARPEATTALIVLPAGPTALKVPAVGRPNRWYALGAIEDERLRALVRDTTAAPAPVPAAGSRPVPATGPTVLTSAAMTAKLGADPLQHSAGRLFQASVAGAGGFALLAVLLTLVRAAPERAALLARLRTMGLRPRQGLSLILAEALPQTLVAAAGGMLLAIAAVALLGPAVDLTSLVGAAVPAGLRPAVLPVLTQALGLAALVSAGVLAEAAVSGRRQITTELRAGDSR